MKKKRVFLFIILFNYFYILAKVGCEIEQRYTTIGTGNYFRLKKISELPYFIL
jgi:hypothetical protein